MGGRSPISALVSKRILLATSPSGAIRQKWTYASPPESCARFSRDWHGSNLSSEAGLLGYDERVALICGERCQLAPEQHQRRHYRWSQKKAEKLGALDASEDAKQNRIG
jgi:hypothetical protein